MYTDLTSLVPNVYFEQAFLFSGSRIQVRTEPVQPADST